MFNHFQHETIVLVLISVDQNEQFVLTFWSSRYFSIAISPNLSDLIGVLLSDSGTALSRVGTWAGKFSPDPVAMETGYIGHGEAFHPNSSKLCLYRPHGFLEDGTLID